MRFSQFCYQLASLGGPNAEGWFRLALASAAKERTGATTGHLPSHIVEDDPPVRENDPLVREDDPLVREDDPLVRADDPPVLGAATPQPRTLKE